MPRNAYHFGSLPEGTMAADTSRRMNFAGLQARLVPLVAELFATLATRNPLRMHFADIAGKTLLDIVQVLRQDGISQEAIAASLGLTMNGFAAKMKRLQEMHEAEAGPNGDSRTLLERVHACIGEHADGAPLRVIQARFRGVKTDSLRGVLTFLVRTGFLETIGRGRDARWRVVERPGVSGPTAYDAAVVLYREGPLSLDALAGRLDVPAERAAELVAALEAAGRIVVSGDGPGRTWRATGFHIPLDTAVGYEAAIHDHLAAVIGAICKKLRLGRHSASMADRIGGATFTFRLPPEHPLHAEVSAFLAESRVRMEGWLKAAQAFDPDAAGPDVPIERITLYVGQTVDRER